MLNSSASLKTERQEPWEHLNSLSSLTAHSGVSFEAPVDPEFVTFSKIKLRFSNLSVEEMYKSSLQEPLRKNLRLPAVVGIFWAAYHLCFADWFRVSTWFLLKWDTPALALFNLAYLTIFISSFFTALVAFNPWGALSWVRDVEKYSVAWWILVLLLLSTFCNRWRVSRFFDEDSSEIFGADTSNASGFSDDNEVVLTLDLALTYVCLVLPIRVRALLLICLTTVLVYIIVASVIGVPPHSSDDLLSLTLKISVLACLAFFGRFSIEMQSRRHMLSSLSLIRKIRTMEKQMGSNQGKEGSQVRGVGLESSQTRCHAQAPLDNADMITPYEMTLGGLKECFKRLAFIRKEQLSLHPRGLAFVEAYGAEMDLVLDSFHTNLKTLSRGLPVMEGDDVLADIELRNPRCAEYIDSHMMINKRKKTKSEDGGSSVRSHHVKRSQRKDRRAKTTPVQKPSEEAAKVMDSLRRSYSHEGLIVSTQGDTGVSSEEVEVSSCQSLEVEKVFQADALVLEKVGTGMDLDMAKISEDLSGKGCPIPDHFILMKMGGFLLKPLLPGLPEASLYRFLLGVGAQYRKENPYHNLLHGLQVLYLGAYFVSSLFLEAGGKEAPTGLDAFSDVELASFYVACLGHDAGHFGRNNAFCVETGHHLAVTYNDKAVLENFHCAQLFRVMYDITCLPFQGFSDEQRKEARALIIDLILATDMSGHIGYVSKLRLRRQAGDFLQGEGQDQDLKLFLVGSIKLADLGHAVLPWSSHEAWSVRCLIEFFDQGDEERRKGLPLSPLMDRSAVSIPESQIGFLQFCVRPLAEQLIFATNLSCASLVRKRLEENLSRWEALKGPDGRRLYMEKVEAEKKKLQDPARPSASTGKRDVFNFDSVFLKKRRRKDGGQEYIEDNWDLVSLHGLQRVSQGLGRTRREPGEKTVHFQLNK